MCHFKQQFSDFRLLANEMYVSLDRKCCQQEDSEKYDGNYIFFSFVEVITYRTLNNKNFHFIVCFSGWKMIKMKDQKLQPSIRHL